MIIKEGTGNNVEIDAPCVVEIILKENGHSSATRLVAQPNALISNGENAGTILYLSLIHI